MHLQNNSAASDWEEKYSADTWREFGTDKISIKINLKSLHSKYFP